MTQHELDHKETAQGARFYIQNPQDTGLQGWAEFGRVDEFPQPPRQKPEAKDATHMASTVQHNAPAPLAAAGQMKVVLHVKEGGAQMAALEELYATGAERNLWMLWPSDKGRRVTGWLADMNDDTPKNGWQKVELTFELTALVERTSGERPA